MLDTEAQNSETSYSQTNLSGENSNLRRIKFPVSFPDGLYDDLVCLVSKHATPDFIEYCARHRYVQHVVVATSGKVMRVLSE